MDPVRAIAATSSRPVTATRYRPAPLRRVLLVDASVHVLHVMKSALDRHGYEVDTALSPAVAAALHGEHGHAAVVVDGDAFGRAGAELASELARRPGSLVVVVGGERRRGLPGDPDAPGERWLRPVSLRYLVARLTAHFGGFDADEPAGGASRAKGPRLSAVGGAPATRG